MEQGETRGASGTTVGYEGQPPASTRDDALASTVADAGLAGALHATAALPASTDGHAKVALGATIAAPLPTVTVDDLEIDLSVTTSRSVLPRVEPAADGVRLVPSKGPRYRRMRALGEGGMGEVALVEDRDIGRTVALKRLHASFGQGAGVVARFVDEVRTIGSLEHPNIVPIHDVGVDEEGRYFFVMKFVDGETLESVIERLRAGEPRAIAAYGMQRRVEIFVGLLRALQLAHARGIVHRDVKPANVMVGRYGEVVLMDWGVARPIGKDPVTRKWIAAGSEMSSEDMRSAPSRASETYAGVLIGTPLYMSPEQAAGKNDELDGRSDLYSACVLFHELLGLRHYREGRDRSLGELLAGIASDEPPAVTSMFSANPANPQGVPVELAHFCRRGLARDPGARWQSADEMIAELEAILDGRCRVQCPMTLMKRTTREVGHFIDRRPTLAMGIAISSGLGILALIANALRDLIV